MWCSLLYCFWCSFLSLVFICDIRARCVIMHVKYLTILFWIYASEMSKLHCPSDGSFWLHKPQETWLDNCLCLILSLTGKCLILRFLTVQYIFDYYSTWPLYLQYYGCCIVVSCYFSWSQLTFSNYFPLVGSLTSLLSQSSCLVTTVQFQFSVCVMSSFYLFFILFFKEEFENGVLVIFPIL